MRRRLGALLLALAIIAFGVMLVQTLGWVPVAVVSLAIIGTILILS